MNGLKRLAPALASAMALLTACSGVGVGAAKSTVKVYKIGVVQLVEHEALDRSYQGFLDGMKDAGYEDGKNLSIDFENAQNEQANCVTIANKFVGDKCDMILAIATPAAQAAAGATKEIPVLITAVTDPETARLVQSNERPGTNVTGTSDLSPVEEQIGLIPKLVPAAKTVGLMYSSSEANSKFQVELAKKACGALGLAYTEATVSSTNEIQQVAQSLVGKVQAVYIPTDNMLASGMKTVTMVTNQAKIPVFVGESGPLANGGLATYGINFYRLGRQTAEMAVKVLKGEAKPADMPIEYQKDMDFSFNDEAAKLLGIAIPQDLREKAAAPSGAQ